MAIKLEDKVNVTAPGGDYPFGDVKDNSGSNDGTNYNRLTNADYFQFFAKMLADSGVVANGLLEDNNNGFQYFEALIANIRATAASATQKGTVERATQSEVNAGTDSTRHLTAALIAGATGIITLAAMKANSVDSDQYIDASIDSEHLSADALAVSVQNDGNTGSFTKIKTKIIEIGDWNMVSTATVSKAHGIGDKDKITMAFVSIRPDVAAAGQFNKDLDSQLFVNGFPDGGYTWDDTNFVLSRRATGFFDSTDYDDTTYNRGFITFLYEE